MIGALCAFWVIRPTKAAAYLLRNGWIRRGPLANIEMMEWQVRLGAVMGILAVLVALIKFFEEFAR